MLKQISNTPIYLKKYLKVSEVAKLLEVSDTTVRNLINSRELPHNRFGRLVCVSQSDLEKFLKERRVK